MIWKNLAPPATLALVVSTVTVYLIGFSTDQEIRRVGVRSDSARVSGALDAWGR